MDHPLYWRVGRPQALEEILGSGVLSDVSDSTTYVVDIDHSADASFALAEMPRFTVIPGGVHVRVLADGTDGDGFRVEIVIPAGYVAAYGYDYGYGGGGADVLYSWARRGVLNGPA